MTKAKIPKWLKSRYEVLWKEFQEKEFQTEEMTKVFKEQNLDDIQGAAMVVSELKKAGWMDVKLNPQDSRKRIYQLRPKEEIIKEAFQIDMNKLSRSDFFK